MKRMSCLTALAFLLSSQPAMPSETPHPTRQDNRIREVIYSDNQVFRIVGVFRSATQIVFSPGERVEHVALATPFHGRSPRQKTRFSSNHANSQDLPI